MSESPVDLASLFGVALKALKSNRQDINQLDGYNGNHGDNMVENMRIITEALQAKRSEAPSDRYSMPAKCSKSKAKEDQASTTLKV